MKRFFAPGPVWQHNGLFLIRIIFSVFLLIHGMEIFNAEKMNGYVSWDNFRSSSLLPYIGKGAEFIAGILLLIGLFTRLACLITIGTFAYITFFVGKGKFWMDDQHPFMFVLLALVFFFTGPGNFSLDKLIFNNKR
jgi:putative oxidoreductase